MDSMTSPQYEPRWHVVIGSCPFLSYLREHFRAPELFVYRHTKTNNFVLCEWLTGKFGRFQELACLGKAPVGSREVIQDLEQMVRGSTRADESWESNRRTLNSFEKDQTEDDIGFYSEHGDLIDHIGQRRRPSRRFHAIRTPGMYRHRRRRAAVG
jgi:hypothetical protein